MDSLITITQKLSLKIPALEDAQAIYEAVDSDREHIRTWLAWVVAQATGRPAGRVQESTAGSGISARLDHRGESPRGVEMRRETNARP